MPFSHVAEVNVIKMQTGHSCSCIECCTAGESLTLHQHAIGLDLTDHYSFMLALPFHHISAPSMDISLPHSPLPN